MPSSKNNGAVATYAMTLGGVADVKSLRYRELTGISLPEGLSYSFSYVDLPNRVLQYVMLPTSGSITYGWGNVAFYYRSIFDCEDNPFPPNCDGYGEDDSDGVVTRTTSRLLAGQGFELGTTTYARSYLPGGTCSTASPQYCQMRVDVFAPVGASTGLSATRSTFWQTDGYSNAAVYGKPIRTDEYFLSPTAQPVSTSVDGQTPFRTTLFTYQSDDVTNGGNPGPKGVNHNAREVERKVTWNSTGRFLDTVNSNWDGYGHWGTVATSEYDGTATKILRQVAEAHLNSAGGATHTSPTYWVLRAGNAAHRLSPERRG